MKAIFFLYINFKTSELECFFLSFFFFFSKDLKLFLFKKILFVIS